MHRFIHVILWSLLFATFAQAQDLRAAFWADSVLSSLSIEERVGQLFMERAFSQSATKDKPKAFSQIKNYHIGGLCFFQGDPNVQANWTEEYQKKSKVPLLIAIDAEWGLGMRFKDKTVSFPKQMTLGAIRDDRLIYEMGQEIGRQCKSIGVSVNFAPVADVNNNPANPVIHYRSFGEDRMNVALKSYQYLLGLESENVLGCVKHFPGHGDTDTDSHYALPVIPHDRDRLDSLELFPFRVIADRDAGSMMIAHLQIPALDDTPGLPSTLSRKIVGDLLRDSLDYDGLIFTDAMDMKGVSDLFSAGEAAKLAFLAGNDIILLPADLGKAHTAIMKAIKEGEITIEDLNQRVFRILRYKYQYINQSTKKPEEIDDIAANVLKTRLYEEAITLLRRETTDIPIRDLEKTSYASLSFGAKGMTEFQKTLEAYVAMPHYQAGYSTSAENLKLLGESLKKQDVIIVGLQDMSYSKSKDFGLTPQVINFLSSLNQEKKVILVVFGTPYALSYLPRMSNIVMAYEEDPLMESTAAQALFGAISMDGVLPVTGSEEFPFGSGMRSSSLGRMGFALPESVGMNSDSLALIDEIVQELIKLKAAPGCQVLVAKNGKIVWNKSYGHHTYEKRKQVLNSDLYDLASITKVAASTMSAMKLQDDGLIDINSKVSKYIPILLETNKTTLTFPEIMSHHAGLAAWIPFYKNTMTEDKSPRPKSEWYSKSANSNYSVQVSDAMYMNRLYQDSMWHFILESDIKRRGRGRYSDLGFYLLGETVKEVSGLSLDAFAQKNFYSPLGLRTTQFNPLSEFSKKVIVPSERDDYFRMGVVHGHVHDMGSAMFGGVAGHAGLFSNASDLSVLMQMILNGGIYGGRQYLRQETISKFTQRFKKNTRRGLGFDMREMDPDRTANMALEASERSFGHLGFTGTAVWVDPDHQLIYVFLSNRTYPTMKNTLLYKNDYRPKIQSVIYRSFLPSTAIAN